jgi:hypothetical protein
MQRFWQRLFIICLCVSQFSCATQALHDIKASSTDELKSFLLAQDGSLLVVAGSKYHFMFSLDEPLRSILKWQKRGLIQPKFDTILVSANQKITSSFRFSVADNSLNAADRTFLKQHQFYLEGVNWQYSDSLKGTRYAAGNVKLPKAVLFNKPFKINMQEPDGLPETALKVALTPLTVTADAVMVTVGFIPMSLVVMGALYEYGHASAPIY